MPWSTPNPAPRRFWAPASWLFAVASIALTVVGWGVASAGPCPSSVVQLARDVSVSPFTVDAFTYDSTFTDVSVVRVTFDRTEATMSLAARSAGRMKASARVVETFDVVGVPPGTPVGATLEFRLDGWSDQNCGGAGCGATLEGWLALGTDSTSADANLSGPTLGRRFVATSLTLPVTFVAGSPIQAQFFLTFGTGPGGGAEVEVLASYTVSGLPPGVHAVACAGADVTPVRRTTWGSLKNTFR